MLLPERNALVLQDVVDEVRDQMTFPFADDVADLLAAALGEEANPSRLTTARRRVRRARVRDARRLGTLGDDRA